MLEKLILECKNDLQVARNRRDEHNVLYRIQCGIIETLGLQLDRLEAALEKSKEPCESKQ
jgi:hypothetical protein